MSAEGCLEHCYPPLRPPAFSKATNWLVFRYAAIQNGFENGHGPKAPLSPAAWHGLSETFVTEKRSPAPDRRIPLADNMSTILRWGSSLFRVGRNNSRGQCEVEFAGEQVDDGLEVAD
jgi:hypothetical protein